MSRSGLYEDDGDDTLAFGRWRAQVASAIRGKRGQAFLKEMLAALDALPQKRLIRNALVIDGYAGYGDDALIVGADELVARDGTVCAMGEVCALGALGKARGMDMDALDPDDPEFVADAFGIAHQLAREIIWINDETRGTPEERFKEVRDWVEQHINDSTASKAEGA